MLTPSTAPEFPSTQPRGHGARFFDRTDSAARHLASFVADGLTRHDTVVVVATQEHWLPTVEHLSRMDAPTAAAIGSGQLVVFDAVSFLNRLAPRGPVDPAEFDASVGALLRELAGRGAPLRIYGEMVSVLAGRGEFAEAERLEHLWNALAGDVPFSLVCGYCAIHFGNDRSEEMLRRLCATHTHVEASLDDELSLWLLTQSGALCRAQPEDVSTRSTIG